MSELSQELDARAPPAAADPDRPVIDFSRYARDDEAGRATLHLLVEGAHCGACVQRIERRLGRFEEVENARLNLTTRRLVVQWRGPKTRANALAAAVDGLGFHTVPFDPDRLRSGDDREERTLLRAMAVAGFAAANVMLLSVAIWSGHAQDMGPATRTMFHWISALIVMPTVAYAGQPFFRSAIAALKARRTNMDVPISLAVILACAMSLFETIRGGEHAYFDSAIMLVFFLLIGRYLDRRARGRARSAAERLLALGTEAVTVIDERGERVMLPPDEVTPGMTVLVAAGQRIAVDGQVTDGRSDVDTSLITGEMVPVAVQEGDTVFAGTINRSAALKLTVTAVGEGTLLGEIVRLMEVAEQRKARHVTLADRIARLYVPVVHGLAAATFLGWVLIGGVAWQVALLNAIAVLIITCPCALGLAIPAVQVIASGRLMRSGILLKSATALERLSAIDTIVFDKTGTLTRAAIELCPADQADPEALRLAASIAGASRHPLARALYRAVPGVILANGVREIAGCGLEWESDDGTVRLGSRDWCGDAQATDQTGPEIWLSRPGHQPVRFVFTDPLRADARDAVGWLKDHGFALELLSGDRRGAVTAAARAVGITDHRSECRPADKVARLEELSSRGARVMMVGDGLNDAPALAAASVSMSPTSAVDISQVAADAVFQGDRLAPVCEALTVARRARRLVTQNLTLAFSYNALAIPLAVMGLITPLIAALCMSASSLLVVGNALRLGRRGRLNP